VPALGEEELVLHRRQVLGGLAAVSGLSTLPSFAQTNTADVPILFVHGNGDQASIWLTTVWRFESNGYRRDLLHAINFSDPTARDVDAVAQANRSSTDDQLRELKAAIDRIKMATGASRLALVGLSRGGNSIRNYVSEPDRAANVSHVVLGGTPNHGVFDWEATLGNEFNARGPFLSRLNSGASEVVPGPAFLTLRSDGLDKYAQPDAALLGKPGVPTGVTAEGPALKGATNLVLGPVDHRETATSPRAFREIYKFISGSEPGRIEILAERKVTLNGQVTGFPAGVPTNRPLKGALVEVFAVSADTGERLGDALLRKQISEDGLWGPLDVPAGTFLEFVIAGPEHPTTHIYMSPFPRSSDIVHLRPGRSIGRVMKAPRPSF